MNAKIPGPIGAVHDCRTVVLVLPLYGDRRDDYVFGDDQDQLAFLEFIHSVANSLATKDVA